MTHGASRGYFGVPTPWRKAEGHTCRVAIARHDGTLRGQRPCARTDTSRTDTSRTGTGRSGGCLPRGWKTASGSPRTHADDGRPPEVGHCRSTWEVAERRRIEGGRDGGKGGGQGKLA